MQNSEGAFGNTLTPGESHERCGKDHKKGPEPFQAPALYFSG
jgi:hypothetical protein